MPNPHVKNELIDEAIESMGRAAVRSEYPAPSSAPCRMSARSVIEARADRLEQEAAGLRKLLGTLPTDIPPVADGALWSLVMRQGGL